MYIKIKYKLLTLFFILIFLTNSFIFSQSSYKPGNPIIKGGETANKGSVTGVIVDKQSSAPVEYANIVIFSAKDSTMKGGALSDSKGNFKIENIPYGKYYIEISFIGYANQKVPNIVIDPNTTTKNLGQIKFSPAASNLDAVTISAEKQLVEYSLDKKVVNVEKNLVSAGGSAVDVLQTVPSVTVDIDGNVSMRGSTNVNILIDGRPSALAGTSRQAVLEQIPASSIESIEIITNPSAKYNPDGMSGIINIKLKKKVARGLNGVATINLGTSNRYSSSLNLNYSTAKYNVFGSWDGRWNTSKYLGDTYRNARVNDTISNTYQHNEGTRTSNNNNFKIGADFYLNKWNTLTIYGQFTIENGDRPQNINSKTYDVNNILNDYFTQTNDEAEKNNSQTYSINYKKTFEQKGRELTLDVSYSNSNNDEYTTMNETFYNNNLTPSSLPPYLQTQDNKGHNHVTNILLNYVHPFTDKFKLETGYQGIIRNVDDNFMLQDYDNTTNNYFANDTASNHFLYNESFHSVFGTLSKEWENGYSAQVGLRFEAAFTNSDQVAQNINVTNNYYNIYPSVHVSKKLPKLNEILISYSRRVNRPDIESLNPFKDYSNPLMIRFGNPYLTPEYVNSFEIGHSKYWKKTSLNSTVFYRQINDVMKRISWLDTLKGVNYMTTENLSKGVSYGVELVVDQEIAKWWRVNASFSYFRTIIEGSIIDGSITNDNYSWTSKLNSTMNFGKGFSIQLSGNYRAPIITPQGKMFAMYSADAAVKKDILKERASIGLRVSDIFNTQHFDMETYGTDFYSRMNRKRESRILYFSFTYKINGGLKQKPAKRPTDGGNGNNDMDY